MTHLRVKYVMTGEEEDDLDPPEELCLEPNPAGTILCDLAKTDVHDLGQHLGWDRRGNLHGWKVT